MFDGILNNGREVQLEYLPYLTVLVALNGGRGPRNIIFNTSPAYVFCCKVQGLAVIITDLITTLYLITSLYLK